MTMAFASLVLVGCADLDTEPMGGTLTADQKKAAVEENADREIATVNAVPAMFSIYGNVSGDHNDFGYPALMLLSDGRGMDLVHGATGYNWFSYGLTMTGDWNISGTSNVLTWETLYNQIFSANELIAKYDRDVLLSDEADAQDKFYLAQGLAIRAFDYFHLAQQYAQTYVGHENDACVPIRTEKNSSFADADKGVARSTVSEVYELITTDLDDAVVLLEASEKAGVEREDKRYVSAAVAHGLRARVRMVMNDWDGARDDAQAAIDQFEGEPLSYTDAAKPGFKSAKEDNWMWGIIILETDRVTTSGIVNWISHMGSFNYGYASVGAWRQINKKLYNSIPNGDARKGWWLNADKESDNLTTKQQQYISSKGCPEYTQVKFAPYNDELGTSLNANDVPLMRIEEMYLALAECQAMAGDPATGKNTLENFVRNYRCPSYTVIGSSAEEIQDAAWQQRRIELWGEGISYWDIVRLKKGIDRRGGGFSGNYVYLIPAEDPIFIFLIPNVETEANVLIDGDKDNNPIPDNPSIFRVPDEEE